MRTLWMLHRRAAVALIVVAVLLVSTAVVTVVALGRGSKGATGTTHPAAAPFCASCLSPATTATPAANSGGYTGPARVTVPQTPTQKQVDEELAQAESPASIAKAEGEQVPAPATSRAYPAVAAGQTGDPTAYALAFSSELLTVDAHNDTRAALLGWAQAEEAPDSFPGVPAEVADKSLVGSLAYAGVAGTAPSPVPPAAEWAKPSSGTTQTVSGLSASVSPDWTQLVASGWQPSDPLLTIMSVTGTITVSTPGHPGAPRSFSLALTLGGARYHSGYGAVAVSNWVEG